MSLEEKIIDRIDRLGWLEPLSKTIQQAVQKLYSSGGPMGIRVRDFLHGVWLGHALHAVLTDVTVGSYVTAMAFDTIELATGGRGPGKDIGKAADTAIAIGVGSAAITAASGATDWQHTDGEARRVGMAHGLMNTGALALFVLSLAARKNGQRSTGHALAFGGYLLTLGAGYLGGHMAYGYKIGVNHAPVEGLPSDFTEVADEQELQEGQLFKAWLGDIPLVLVRRGGQVYALAEQCAHMGGPLAEGKLGDDLSIICPWHASKFSLEDGRVLQGPSVYEQPCFETRLLKGKVEVRLKPNPNIRS